MLWKDCGSVEGPRKGWGTAVLLDVSDESCQEAWLEDSASSGHA